MILDPGLLRMRSQEFATAYQRLKAGTAPIIVLSAGGDARIVAVELGATACLSTPFSREELSQAVQRAAPAGPRAFAST